MTLIEFYEKTDIENICSSLAVTPERVILLGDNMDQLELGAERCLMVLEPRGAYPDFICRCVGKGRISEIVDALSEIVETYEDCVFDLTGGGDLYLVAMGIVFERYRERNIQMHRFNIRNNTVIDVDQDGHTILTGEAPTLSVEENIRLYGGEVVYEDMKTGTTYPWEITDDFAADINAIWEICRRDLRRWNEQIHLFEAAEGISAGESELTTRVPTVELQSLIEGEGYSFGFRWEIVKGLVDAELLSAISCDDSVFSVTYKNAQVKRCLTLAGRALEMKIFLAALDAREKNGERTYDDVLQGVFIDWDGVVHADPGDGDIENEIDVILMRGMLPVFVSCKSGRVGNDELFKLNAVAERFGGKYAKKVLVAPRLGELDVSGLLRQRAGELGIRVVEGLMRRGELVRLTDLTEPEFNKLMRSLWSNG